MTHDPADDHAPELFDFLEELERDRARGALPPVEHYLARFPEAAAAVRAEYQAQTSPPPAPAPAAPEEPRCVGPYRLERELGRGGQGVVWLAEDTRFQRRVALKLLPPAALLLSADRRARLRREAEVVSKLEHVGICAVYDAEMTDDVAYIAMRYVEGETLAHVVARASRRERGAAGDADAAEHPPVRPREGAELFALLAFFEAAARALHAAHSVGVVHRDVKPANLMVTPAGEPVWLDFGQARDTEGGGVALTVSGEVFGTPAYMSPEQITGHRAALDPRTDVWALGVSLFEALTLERPFEAASTHALLFAIQTEEPRAARALNPVVTEELEVVLATALEKDLARRYASAGALADELARLRNYEPILARPASAALKLRRWSQRHPWVLTSVGGLVLLLSLGLVWTLYLLGLKDVALEHALGRHLAERTVSLLDQDPAAALILGIEAVQREPTYQTRSALYAALERCYLKGELDGSPARLFRDIELTPDRRRVFAALSDGSARLYELESRRQVASWAAHAGGSSCVAVDGPLGACGGEDGTAVVYDLDARRELLRTRALGAGVERVAFVALDGGAALVVEAAGEALAVDVASARASSRAPRARARSTRWPRARRRRSPTTRPTARSCRSAG
ncbi:MAG: protein kinase [Planctomycetes bacterium]|nr:protein kinase [Planctomycetota bacterium]